LESTRSLFDKTEETFNIQRREREETLDTYFDELRHRDETEQPKRPQEMLDELSGMLRAPVRLNGDLYRDLPLGGREVKDELQKQVSETLLAMNLTRLVGAFERRLDDSLGLSIPNLSAAGWIDAREQILKAVEANFDRRTEKLTGEQGEVTRNIDALVSRQPLNSDQDLLLVLMLMAHGVKMTIDTRTHRKGWRRTTLLNYIYLAASELQRMDSESARGGIQKHLNDSLENSAASGDRSSINILPNLVELCQSCCRECVPSSKKSLELRKRTCWQLHP